MFVNVRVVFFLAILNILENSKALVELPHVEDNEILNTESIIRATTNELFSSIKLKGVKHNPKLKRYGLTHNYFVSLTLKDYKNLKEIARLTRTDKKTIYNSSVNFIDLINEILNEDSSGFDTKSKTSGDTFDNEVGHYIDGYSHNFAYLKETYGDNSPRVDINNDIINILDNDNDYLNKTAFKDTKYQGNDTTSDYDDLLDDNDFWTPDQEFRRIYKGQRTKVKYFPFMASVQFFNNFQCGGSIIKNDLVITAASCLQLAWNNRLFRENPSFLSVRIGSNYYEGGGESIAVLEIYFYPTYNPRNLRNNLAIMRLSRKIRFKYKKISRVKKIDFDRKDYALPQNIHDITIVGWGAKTSTNNVGSPWDNKISFAVLDVYNLKDCQDTYSKEYVSHTNFCAGKLAAGSGACNRDVGDPGMVGGILMGVVSFGSPVCGTPDAPTVFTKVGFYADWIEEIMEQDNIMPEGKRLTTLAPLAYTVVKPDPPPPTTVEDPPPETPVTLPSLLPLMYNESVLYPPIKAIGKDSLLFKQFLKTMFNSKEIEEYLDLANNEEAEMKNAEIIGIRQQQLAQNVPYIYNTPEQQLVTVQPVDEIEDFTFISESDETEHKPVEYVTKVDESLLYISDKENHFKAESGIKLKKHEKVKNFSKLENHDKIENYNTIISSKENIEINHMKEYEEGEARKELESNLKKLLQTVDLKEKIASVAKKFQIQAAMRDKNEHKDIDNTVLTLLYVSDSEKQNNGSVNLRNEDGTGILTDFNEENDNITDIEDSSEYSSEDSSGTLEKLEKFHATSVEDKMDEDDISIRKGININSTSISSLNGTSIFSKQLLFEILSDMIDYQNANKTIKI